MTPLPHSSSDGVLQLIQHALVAELHAPSLHVAWVGPPPQQQEQQQPAAVHLLPGSEGSASAASEEP